MIFALFGVGLQSSKYAAKGQEERNLVNTSMLYRLVAINTISTCRRNGKN